MGGRGSRGRVVASIALAALASSGTSGCVKRRYTIRTDPPGALVLVNGAEIGALPVSKSFTYYGTRDVTLIAPDGTQKKILQPIDAPWWDNILTDFFTENVVPFTLRDEREFNYKIEPAVPPPQDQLLDRAQGLRIQGQQPLPARRKGLLGWFQDKMDDLRNAWN